MIHAGGKGLRLQPITLLKPKPLIELGIVQKPLIYWSMLPAIKAGVKKFVITTNYMSEQVESYFSNGEWSGFDIKIFKEPKKLGKSGATKQCIEEGLIDRDKPVLMQNAADITRNFVPDLLREHERQVKRYGYEMTLVIAEKCLIPSSKVEYDQTTKAAVSFQRRPEHVWQYGEGSHVGMFLFEPKSLERFNYVTIPSDPEDNIAHDLITEKKVNIFLTDGWIPIKFSSDIEYANKIDIEKFQESINSNKVGRTNNH
jgi:NDP-sugar pyrophosphorylase family protein